jgi:rare lipoprotein A
MKRKLETILIVMLAFVIAIAILTGTAKADCFPCFDQNTVTYKQKTTKKKNTRQKTVTYDTSDNTGIASYYWQPQAVACGGRLNPRALTAAHKTYPCGSRVLVTNMRNGATVIVTINDRGPFVRGRIIDLSLAAAQQIGMVKSGLTKVTIQRI